MSRTLPTTLEDMQYEILQGDLTLNPRLQKSAIPAKDKELKTTAKKIIPAINELLKLLDTCKQSVDTYSNQIEEKVKSVTEELADTIKKEQLVYINAELDKVKSETSQLVSKMGETLNQSYAESVQQQFVNLQQQIDELTDQKFAERMTELESKMNELAEQKIAESMLDVETKIEEVVSAKLAEQGAGTGSEGAELKRVFHSKVRLAKGDTVILPFKASEIQDINKQVDGYVYSSYRTNKFIKYSTMFADKTGSTSIWDVSTFPVDFRLDEDTDEITLVNSSNYEVMLYFFSME